VHEPAQIVALVATRFRTDLLSRLLGSLQSQTLLPVAVVITDNGPDPATERLPGSSSLPLELVSPGKNLGFGGGLALAGERALRKFPGLTHFLVVDDDAILSPGDLQSLLDSSKKYQAGTIAPFLTDAAGKLQEAPEPVRWSLARSFRKAGTNLEKARSLAPSGYSMAWCLGPCVLIRKDTWLRAGPPRSDMLAYGDDVEFSLRLSASDPAWAEPSVAVTHAPPPSQLSMSAESAFHQRKFGMLLQNLAFTCVVSPRPRHLPLYLPGNALRFLRTFGFSPSNILEVMRCYALGFLGVPAGR